MPRKEKDTVLNQDQKGRTRPLVRSRVSSKNMVKVKAANRSIRILMTHPSYQKPCEYSMKLSATLTLTMVVHGTKKYSSITESSRISTRENGAYTFALSMSGTSLVEKRINDSILGQEETEAQEIKSP